jgi:hypothetical protein
VRPDASPSPASQHVRDIRLRHTNGHWWSLACHGPFREAQFTRQTPVEAVAAVIQALPQLLGDHRHAERIPLASSALAQIADLSHWHDHGSTFASPDGHCHCHCHLHHTPGDETPWRFRPHPRSLSPYTATG